MWDSLLYLSSKITDVTTFEKRCILKTEALESSQNMNESFWL
jgi:hypothetical protein